jgi:phosphatidylinositol-3-phosphatase
MAILGSLVRAPLAFTLLLITVVLALSGSSGIAEPVGAGASTDHSAGAGPISNRIPQIRRFLLIVFENKSYEQVIGQRSAPEFNALARRYALLTRFYAVAHPSLPNYLALVSGSTQGVTENCTDCTFSSRNLADTIEASRRTWKTYAEGLPAPGFTGAKSGAYAKKHNPFLYFEDVLSSPTRLGRVVPLDDFHGDLARGALPNFSLVIPDLCSDMHDCSVAHGDAWLGTFLKPLLARNRLAGTVVFVLFDEGSHDDTAGGGGRVPALVLGPLVRKGARNGTSLSHYSVLRTIEDAWHLPRLGASSTARPVTGIWR